MANTRAQLTFRQSLFLGNVRIIYGTNGQKSHHQTFAWSLSAARRAFCRLVGGH